MELNYLVLFFLLDKKQNKTKTIVIPRKEFISYFSHSCVLSPNSSPSFAHFHLGHRHLDFHNQCNSNITTTTIITWEIIIELQNILPPGYIHFKPSTFHIT